MAGKRTLVYGVGVNDAVGITGWRSDGKMHSCPHYQRWRNMLGRCYDSDIQSKQPSYKGCTVHPTWLKFSNFKTWMDGQNWIGKFLDKDLLVDGNKEYGPETCVLLDRVTNNFLTDRAAMRGDFPIGVSWHKTAKKFCASISNPFTKKQEHLGLYNSATEAHEVWRLRKKHFASELAGLQEDRRVAERLRYLF